MNERNRRFFNASLIALIVVAVVIVVFGPLGITGFAPLSSVTSTSIFYPATGSEFTQGSSFTVSAVISCKNARCQHVVSGISFAPTPGLSIAKGYKTSYSLGNMAAGSSRTVTWLVEANAVGSYQILVSTTSKSAAQTNALAQVDVFVPRCSSNADCGSSGYVSGPYCGADGSVYRDYTSAVCENPGTSSASCNVSTAPKLVLNCGTSGFVGNAFCSNSSVYRMYMTASCASGSCTNLTQPVKVSSCSYGCSNGACLPPPPSCTDSDGGFVPLVKGTVSGVNGGAGYSYTDSCLSSSSLTEYFCSNTTASSWQVSCGSSGFVGSAFCDNNSVYRTYITAGCSLGACYNQTSKVIVDSCLYGCSGGACINVTS